MTINYDKGCVTLKATSDGQTQFPFKIVYTNGNDDLIRVYKRDSNNAWVELRNPTDFQIINHTVFEFNVVGATVELASGINSGEELLIERHVPITQPYNFDKHTGINPDYLEAALDYRTFVDQELDCRIVDLESNGKNFPTPTAPDQILMSSAGTYQNTNGDLIRDIVNLNPPVSDQMLVIGSAGIKYQPIPSPGAPTPTKDDQILMSSGGAYQNTDANFIRDIVNLTPPVGAQMMTIDNSGIKYQPIPSSGAPTPTKDDQILLSSGGSYQNTDAKYVAQLANLPTGPGHALLGTDTNGNLEWNGALSDETLEIQSSGVLQGCRISLLPSKTSISMTSGVVQVVSDDPGVPADATIVNVGSIPQFDLTSLQNPSFDEIYVYLNVNPTTSVATLEDTTTYTQKSRGNKILIAVLDNPDRTTIDSVFHCYRRLDALAAQHTEDLLFRGSRVKGFDLQPLGDYQMSYEPFIFFGAGNAQDSIDNYYSSSIGGRSPISFRFRTFGNSAGSEVAFFPTTALIDLDGGGTLTPLADGWFAYYPVFVMPDGSIYIQYALDQYEKESDIPFAVDYISERFDKLNPFCVQWGILGAVILWKQGVNFSDSHVHIKNMTASGIGGGGVGTSGIPTVPADGSANGQVVTVSGDHYVLAVPGGSSTIPTEGKIAPVLSRQGTLEEWTEKTNSDGLPTNFPFSFVGYLGDFLKEISRGVRLTTSESNIDGTTRFLRMKDFVSAINENRTAPTINRYGANFVLPIIDYPPTTPGTITFYDNPYFSHKAGSSIHTLRIYPPSYTPGKELSLNNNTSDPLVIEYNAPNDSVLVSTDVRASVLMLSYKPPLYTSNYAFDGFVYAQFDLTDAQIAELSTGEHVVRYYQNINSVWSTSGIGLDDLSTYTGNFDKSDAPTAQNIGLSLNRSGTPLKFYVNIYSGLDTPSNPTAGVPTKTLRPLPGESDADFLTRIKNKKFYFKFRYDPSNPLSFPNDGVGNFYERTPAVQTDRNFNFISVPLKQNWKVGLEIKATGTTQPKDHITIDAGKLAELNVNADTSDVAKGEDTLNIVPGDVTLILEIIPKTGGSAVFIPGARFNPFKRTLTIPTVTIGHGATAVHGVYTGSNDYNHGTYAFTVTQANIDNDKIYIRIHEQQDYTEFTNSYTIRVSAKME